MRRLRRPRENRHEDLEALFCRVVFGKTEAAPNPLRLGVRFSLFFLPLLRALKGLLEAFQAAPDFRRGYDADCGK